MENEQSSEVMSDPEVLAGIRRIVLDHKRNSRRVNTLSLYNERISIDGNEIIAKSTVKADDSPEIEQILKYRDQVSEMDESLAYLKRKMIERDDGDETDYARLQESIGKLRMESMRSIDKIIAEMRKDFTHKERMMALLATEAAKLSQGQRQHVDKIRVAEMAILRGKPMSDDAGSAIERLAEKHHLTVEQVKEMVQDSLPVVIPDA